jgi:hypothetical protein
MESSNRLKIKIGPHEFEAEGNSEAVQEQFRIFTEMIASISITTVPQTQNTPQGGGLTPQAQPQRGDMPSLDSALDKITKIEDRTVSLTVRPKTVDDAVLVLLYSQKTLRENDAVTGAEIMNGITATGGMSVARVDKLLEKLGRDGDVIVIGERRSKRYRLTNAGLAKARQVATDLLAIVA